MIFQAWARTDVGKYRTLNEDCHLVDADNGLILVFDGMGGHLAGEVASRLAMETMAEFYKRYAGNRTEVVPRLDNYDPAFSYHCNVLRHAVFEANRVVLEKSLQTQQLSGMGSTVAGMAIREFTVSTINVGDSRIYLIRNNMIEQISIDHTLANDQVERGVMTPEEAYDSDLRHVLSSVIGVDTEVQVHVDELSLLPADIFLLCTDGLTAVMKDDEILTEIRKTEVGPETLDRLIDEANRRGGPDNVTVALVVVSDNSAARMKF
ncbi:MAG TPA: protein phosphatase 2C domain-containing protein [Desulfomonilaceae bacterium]|nr:protein phosphatase 2C domain-containing protein [Desulfomonilaceae bacterium]